MSWLKLRSKKKHICQDHVSTIMECFPPMCPLCLACNHNFPQVMGVTHWSTSDFSHHCHLGQSGRRLSLDNQKLALDDAELHDADAHDWDTNLPTSNLGKRHLQHLPGDLETFGWEEIYIYMFRFFLFWGASFLSLKFMLRLQKSIRAFAANGCDAAWKKYGFSVCESQPLIPGKAYVSRYVSVS